MNADGSTVSNRWWLCPNDPPCPHAAVLHDIEEPCDPSPTCCIEGCTCGGSKRREKS